MKHRELNRDQSRKLALDLLDRGKTSDEIKDHFKKLSDFWICPECGDHPTPTRPHRLSGGRRVYHREEQYTEIAKPDFDRAYIYKDYHGDLICSKCGLIFDHLNAFIPSENHQGPDNSDHRGNNGGESGDTRDPIYSIFNIKRLDKLESKVRKMMPDKDRDKIVDSKTMKITTTRFNMEIGKDVTKNYCRETGTYWFGRALIRTDLHHPETKHIFCLVCWKANAGQPYRNRKSWHHIKKKDTKQRGYNEQAVLTAITAKRGRSISDIAEFCWANFKDGKFSYGNVHKIIKQYETRGMVAVVDGGYKNNKVVI